MDLFRHLSDHQAPWRVFAPRASFVSDMESRYRAALEDPDALLLVAEDGAGSDLVGMALGQLHRPSLFSDELAVELSSVIVLPEHRGRGIGRALAEEVGRFARSRGARHVILKTFAQNEEATAFWLAQGFVPRAIQMVAPADVPGSGEAAGGNT